MKTITIHIEDSKYGFFINLLKRFDFVKIDTEDNSKTFSATQKKLLDQRLDELLNEKVNSVDWETVKSMLS